MNDVLINNYNMQCVDVNVQMIIAGICLVGLISILLYLIIDTFYITFTGIAIRRRNKASKDKWLSTYAFKNKAEFDARKDKSISGWSLDFCKLMQFNYNGILPRKVGDRCCGTGVRCEGCWNCFDCVECTECDDCWECGGCFKCLSCMNCYCRSNYIHNLPENSTSYKTIN